MKDPRISAIAAIGENRELGKNNNLLFKIPEDFQRMKRLTLGHPIIMGRKTFESIGRILPGRFNIIVSRAVQHEINGGLFVNSLEQGLKIAEETNTDEIFIFGGGQMYSQAFPLTERLYLTVVKGKFDADTYFPDYTEFTKVIEKEEKEGNGYSYTFLTLDRK